MEENGLISAIFEAIPEEETVFVMDSCEKAAEAIYKYSLRFNASMPSNTLFQQKAPSVFY